MAASEVPPAFQRFCVFRTIVLSDCFPLDCSNQLTVFPFDCFNQLPGLPFDCFCGKWTNPGGTRVGNFSCNLCFADLDGTRTPQPGARSLVEPRFHDTSEIILGGK